MLINRTAITLFIACFLSASAVSAATLEEIKDGNGRTFAVKVTNGANDVQLAKPSSNPKSIADSFILANKELLRVKNPSTDLLAHPLQSDEHGSRQKYDQSYLGIPVYGAELSVHMDTGGKVTYVKTKIVDGLPEDVRPEVSQKAAVAAALKLAAVEAGNVKLTASKTDLVILPLHIINNTPKVDNRLAWKVEVTDTKSKGDGLSTTYFRDAKNDELLLTLSGHIELTREIRDCAGGSNGTTCQTDIESPIVPGYFHGRSEGAPVRGPYPHIAGRTLYWDSVDVDLLHGYMGTLHNYYSTTFGINGPNGQGGLADWPSVPAYLTKAVAHNDSGGAGDSGCPSSIGLFSSIKEMFLGIVTKIIGETL